MNDHAPDFWQHLRDELGGPHWRDRAVVLGAAIATGAVVVAFTWLAEHAFGLWWWLAHAGRDAGPWGEIAVLAWTPALTVAVLWATRRWMPGGQGSGIPQVILALDEDTPPALRRRLVSLGVAGRKVLAVVGSLAAGLSLGREGPTVQVGAGVMLHCRRWLSREPGIDAHDLMVAGAAAGVAAAFNTPLGGVVFALEQLSRRRSMNLSALVLVSIVLAGLVSVSVWGNATYFGRVAVGPLSWSLLLPGLVVAVGCGLAGGLLSRLIVASLRGLPDRASAWRQRAPLRFAAACAFGVALIGLVSAGQTAGAGYAATRGLLEGAGEPEPLYTLLKFLATWLSAWTGVPGGIFSPSLAIGAGLGHDVAQAFSVDRASGVALIALGMAGFLAATTQGPLTAFIIVMEMIAGQSMVLSLMACVLLASGVSRWVARPMYLELAHLVAAAPWARALGSATPAPASAPGTATTSP